MSENTDRLMALAIMVMVAGLLAYFGRRAARQPSDKTSLRDVGPRIPISTQFCGVALGPGAFAYLISPPWMAWAQVGAPFQVPLGGAGLGLLVHVLAFWILASPGGHTANGDGYAQSRCVGDPWPECRARASA